MKMIVRYDGYEYVSPDDDGLTEEKVELVYEKIPLMDNLKMELEDGGFLVLPKKSLQRCAILFK